MVTHVRSISAKDISAEVRSALQKLAASRESLKGAGEPEFVISPHSLIGFVLRDPPKSSPGELQEIAAGVAKAIPGAKGTTPAVLLHGKEVLIGFVPDLNLTTIRE